MNARRPEPVSDAVRQEVGARIRKHRKALGLSLAGLGALLENANGNPVARDQVSRWERGVNVPEPRYYQQIADALRRTPAEIFGSLADERGSSLLAKVQELQDRVAALTDILDLTDAVEASMRARRVTSRAADTDVESESPADLALRLGDQDESEGRSASG